MPTGFYLGTSTTGSGFAFNVPNTASGVPSAPPPPVIFGTSNMPAISFGSGRPAASTTSSFGSMASGFLYHTVNATTASEGFSFGQPTSDVAARFGASAEADRFAKNFESVFLNEEYSDITITVGTREFPAHKVILAAQCPVFASMLQHQMLENISGTLKIEDCNDPDSFEGFLKYLYTGRTDHVTSSNVLGIYKIAHKYLLKELQEVCVDTMSNNLTIENVCEVADLCVEYSEKELSEKAADFFIENSTDILKTEKWLTFLSERTSTANGLMERLAKAFHSLKSCGEIKKPKYVL